jgi:cell division GTPase FtsZ
MKLAVIGLGQCGGRIADEFARMQMRSRGLRGLDIIVEAMVVNTDSTDLASITSIKSDAGHRLLIGSTAARGHGTAHVGDLGAEIMRRESGKILEALDRGHKMAMADAIIVIAATAGGTGSGGIPVLVRALKQRVTDKPVYALLVLPFEHEENEQSAIVNTAICLKSTNAAADAVILADNQRFIRGEASLRENILKINQQLVDPFMDLLCAGEEKKPRSGTKSVNAGDVIATLDGWSSLGKGKPVMPLMSPVKGDKRDTLRREFQSDQGMFAMNEAFAQMSFNVRPSGAYKALYLVAGPGKELNANLTEGLAAYLKNAAPNAQIRGGDYARDRGELEVTVVLSNFGETERMRYFREKSKAQSIDRAAQQQAKADRVMLTEEAGRDIPSLL